jgi:hypothetical protein
MTSQHGNASPAQCAHKRRGIPVFHINRIMNTANSSRMLSIACWCVAVLHILLVLHHFPPSTAFHNQPLTSDDLSYHFASDVDTGSFLKNSGRLWGYSPYFMCGHPAGLWNSFGKKAHEILSAVLPISFPRALYLWIVLAAGLPPLIIALAARVAGCSTTIVQICLLVTIALTQFGDLITFFWKFGNVAFPFGSALAVLATALLRQALLGGWLSAVGAGFVAALTFWVHPIAMVPLCLGAVAVLAVEHRALASAESYIRLLLAAATAFALIWPWFSELIQFLDFRAPMQLEGGAFPLQVGLKQFVTDMFTNRNPCDPMRIALVAGMVGYLTPKLARQPIEPFFWAACALIVCAYGCSYVPKLAQLQPYRFMVSFELFMALPSAMGIYQMAQWWRATEQPGRALSLTFFCILLLGLGGYVLNSYTNPPASPPTEAMQQCLNWLNDPGRLAGRVGCDDIELGNLIPYYTGREVIGGGMSIQAQVPQQWASLGGGRAFGHSFSEISDQKLVEMCQLLGIFYVIADEEPLIKKLDGQSSSCQLEAQFKNFHIFRINPNHSPVIWAGCYTGKVEAAPDRIEIHDAPPGKFTLNYHYLRTLRSENAQIGTGHACRHSDAVHWC